MLLTDNRSPLIIGDIHGCYLEFLQLLKKINYHKTKHRLILLGDLINRGPDSFKVLKWAREHKIETIMGNHERGFLKGLQKEGRLNSTLKELKNQMGDDLQDWINWMKNWPYFIETKDFIAVHGGLVPGESPKNSETRLLANIRTWDGQGIRLADEKNPLGMSFIKAQNWLSMAIGQNKA